MMRVAATLLALSVLAQTAAAQSLEDRIRDADAERVQFEFRARPGVCGDGHNLTIRHLDDDGDYGWDCDTGPVRVALSFDDGVVDRVKWKVGGRPRLARGAVELGEVDPQEAADYLLDLVDANRRGIADDALDAAVLARDVEIWPRLLRIARDRERRNDVRKTAIFWLGQAAGDKLTAELGDFIEDDSEDLELREHAIFALSQRDDSIERLMRIAKTHETPQLRRTALFWLAQHDEPEVIDLFEEILAGG